MKRIFCNKNLPLEDAVDKVLYVQCRLVRHGGLALNQINLALLRYGSIGDVEDFLGGQNH